jgi:hypothetical protein
MLYGIVSMTANGAPQVQNEDARWQQSLSIQQSSNLRSFQPMEKQFFTTGLFPGVGGN